jgi:peptidoglycan/LPS O-acetylase OafA/YrhL
MDMVPFVLWVTYPYHLCGEWFTSVILALYLLYPLLRRGFAEKRTRAVFCICIFSLCAVNLKIGFLTANDWFSYSRGLFFFLAGMLFEEYRDRLADRKVTAALAGCFLAIFVFFGRSFLGSGRLPNVVSALCAFPVLYRLPGMLKKFFALPFVRKAVDGTCDLNYLIYLTHHYLIELLMPVLLPEEPGTALFYLFTAGICALIFGYSALIAVPVNAALKLCLTPGRKAAA